MSPDPPDRRLLPSAVLAWGVCALGPYFGVLASAGFALATTAVAALTARARPAICVMLLVGAAASAGVALRLAAIDRGPLDDLAAERRSATVVATIAEEPRRSLRRTWGATPVTQVVVRVRVSEVSVAGGQVTVRQPMLVVGQGAEWDAVEFGDQLRLDVSLHPADQVDPFAAVGWVRGPPEEVAPAGPVLRGAEAMRAGLRAAATELAPDPRGLLPALVVGDTTRLPPDLVIDLRNSGLAHLTAVSGANVAIVVTAAVLLARWGGVRGAAVPAVAVVSTLGFVVLARPDPSVLRAAVMGTVAVLAVVVGGRRPGQAALYATVVRLLLVDPWLARSWGFALSVAATAGLLLVAPRWRERWSRRMPPPLAEAAAVAWAAQVATLPLSVALSGQVSLVAVPANVLAAPAVPPATVLGAAAAVSAPVAPAPAGWLVWLAGFPAGWICAVARRGAAWPMAATPWPDAAAGSALMVATLAAGALALMVLRRRSRAFRVVAALAAAALVGAALAGPLRWPPPGWVIVACDVGQGDGLVVAAGNGAAVVVDVGPDPAVMARCLDRLGVHQIPLLVLTHDHADHVMGLPGALGDRAVGQVLTSPLAEPEEQAAAVAQWTGDAGVPAVPADVGMHGSVGDVTWQVLAPERVIRGQGSDPNNASVVLLVEVRGVRLLLTGDIEPAAQAALLASGADLRADVLKVPHHGSVYQDPNLVAAVHPAVALVSVGEDNPYGHPAPELIAGLEADAVLVGRTDTSGDIAVSLGTGGLRMVTRRRRPRRRERRGVSWPAGVPTVPESRRVARPG